MTVSHLPAVNWQEGQTLLPDHLIAQENSLIANMALRDQCVGLPNYGISHLAWETSALEQGCFQVSRLRLISQAQSLLIDFPQNTKVVSAPLAFSDLASAEVYYTLLEEISPEDDSLNCDCQGGSGSQVNKRLYKLLFTESTNLTNDYDQYLQGHTILEQAKLASFETDSQGIWKLSHAFVPPLLQIGTHPFFSKPLENLGLRVHLFCRNLEKYIDQRELSESQRLSTAIGVLGCNSVLRYLNNLGCLRNTKGEISLHPFFLYEQLSQLIGFLKLSSGKWEASELQTYIHDDLAGVFKTLFRQLSSYLKNTDDKNQHIEFILKNGAYEVSLSHTPQESDRFYLLIKPKTSTHLELKDLPKLGSKRSLRHLAQYSLNGIPLTEVKQDELNKAFSSDFQYFRLMESKALSQALSDRSLAFLAQTDLQYYRFYLCQKGAE